MRKDGVVATEKEKDQQRNSAVKKRKAQTCAEKSWSFTSWRQRKAILSAIGRETKVGRGGRSHAEGGF